MSPAGHNYYGIGEQVDEVGQSIAKAALGIPEDAEVRGLDLSKLQLFVAVKADGWVIVNATIPKRDAAAAMRHIADQWEQEWKSEERAEQKRRREGGES